jgi:hypothetical protein
VTDRPDVLILSLGTTRGLRIADEQLAAGLRLVGASVEVAAVRIGATDRLRRGYPVNDVVEAIAARRALASAVARLAPRSVIFSSTTAALLARPPAGVPYAVYLDSPAVSNRPGVRNALLHRLERASLGGARRVLLFSEPAAASLPAGAAPWTVVSPPLGEPAPAPVGDRPVEPGLVVAYTPDVKAKGLELVCRTWALIDDPGARLLITGANEPYARAFLARRGVALPPGAEFAGMLPPARFAELLSGARAYLSAARWEDFGEAPLQALDHGAVLVAAPGGGPFPALALARSLGPEFVAEVATPEALSAALARALAAPESALIDYRVRARAALAPYRPAAQLERLRDEVLPALGL